MKPNGGPAFPSPTGNAVQAGELTVRDWFAGQALAGYLASYSGTAKLPPADHAAGWAYAFADEMLKRRAQ